MISTPLVLPCRLALPVLALVVSVELMAASTATTAGVIACTTQPTPYYPPNDDQQKSNLKALGNRVTGLQLFSQAAFGKIQGMKIDAAVKVEEAKAQEQLLWSGKKVALVEVVMQRDREELAPPEFLYSSVVGYGSCTYDILVENSGIDLVKKDVDPRYVIDESASYYIQLSIKDGKLNARIELPGSRKPLLDRAYADTVTKSFLDSRIEFENHAKLLSVAKEAMRREGELAARVDLQKAADQLDSVRSKEIEIVDRLNVALQAEANLSGAQKWVRDLQGSVTVANLIAHTEAMLGASTPSATKQAIKRSTSPTELSDVLARREIEEQSTVTTTRGDYTLIRTEYKKQEEIILKGAAKNGAPPGLMRKKIP